MTTISTYIWGIRYGFEANHALFPEKVRLDDPEKIKEYDEIVQNFTEQKDSWFRICNRDFYFMLQNNKYRLYSLVVSNHNDIAGRKSFLVFSLVCPTGKILLGDVVGVLNQLKALYKEKNADETINRNLFTADHVNRLVQVLNVVPQTSGQTVSNSIFTINSEDQIPKIFRDYVGNEVYYIAEGTNAEMIASMPTHFKQRKFGDRIDVPVPPVPVPPVPVPPVPVPPVPVPPVPVPPVPVPPVPVPPVPVPPTPVPVPPGGTGTTFEDRLKKIYTACETARKNSWRDDITEIEKLISSEPALEKRLQEFHLPDYENLQNWRAFQAESIGKLVENEFITLHKEIYASSKRDRKNKHDEFNNKVKNLKLKVDALTHEATKTRITTEQRYHDLVIAKTWVPKKNRLVIPIILIGVIALIGLVLLFFNNGGGKVEQVDTDHDGVFDDKDKEIKTPWVTTPTNDSLKDYVNAKGILDTLKTKKLCDCWKYTNIEDRDILKCNDNLNWFVYEGKLYYFDSIAQGDGNFYFEEGKKVKSGNDDGIEKHHKRNNENFYKETENQDLEATAADQTEIVTITYQGKTYQIKRGFTADKGNEFGKKGDDGFIPIWRFNDKNDKWEKQSSKGGPWQNATAEDIKALFASKKVCPETIAVIKCKTCDKKISECSGHEQKCKTCNKKISECNGHEQKCKTCNKKLSECGGHGCDFWISLKTKYGETPSSSNISNSDKRNILKNIKDQKYNCSETEGKNTRLLFIGLVNN
jgi:hypothetical protein